MKNTDPLLDEYSTKAAEQSKARGGRPPAPAQPKQRRVERVMRADPASLKKIESRAELLDQVLRAAPDVPIGSIIGGKAKRRKKL